MIVAKNAGKTPNMAERASQLPGVTALPGFSMHSVLDSFSPLPGKEGPLARKRCWTWQTWTLQPKGASLRQGGQGLCSPSSTHGQGPQALLASLGNTLDSRGSLGAATYSEFKERRPWKASGAISAIWLLLRSLQDEQKRGWLHSAEATKPYLILSTFQVPWEGRGCHPGISNEPPRGSKARPQFAWGLPARG